MYFQDFTMQLLMRKLCKNFREVWNLNKLRPISSWLFCKHCMWLWRHCAGPTAQHGLTNQRRPRYNHGGSAEADQLNRVQIGAMQYNVNSIQLLIFITLKIISTIICGWCQNARLHTIIAMMSVQILRETVLIQRNVANRWQTRKKILRNPQLNNPSLSRTFWN